MFLRKKADDFIGNYFDDSLNQFLIGGVYSRIQSLFAEITTHIIVFQIKKNLKCYLNYKKLNIFHNILLYFLLKNSFDPYINWNFLKIKQKY